MTYSVEMLAEHSAEIMHFRHMMQMPFGSRLQASNFRGSSTVPNNSLYSLSVLSPLD